ncbi:3649_t:CDS:2, partial [Entrophospora sp. SA101]
SLETIVDCEEGKKKEKAKYLLQRYREAVRRSGGDRKSGLQLCKLKDNQTDRQEAKRWENAQRSVRSGSLFHFYNPKFEGNSLVGEGIINDFHQSEKRSREKDHGVVP